MSQWQTWRKGTYSDSGTRVAVALVRDSKATEGDALVFSIQAWRAFVVSVA